MTERPVIVWFRQDLRRADNPALAAAQDSGRPVLPLFVLDDDAPGDWAWGGASRWWLHHSLERLRAGLERINSGLVLRRGDARDILPALAGETGAAAVYWNRCYEPFAIDRDGKIKADLKEKGIAAESFSGNLLFEPWTVETAAGGPYKVFTPFYKACLKGPSPRPPLPTPTKLAAPDGWPGSDRLEDWGLLPTSPDWAGGLRDTWVPGEAGARDRLADFLDGPVAAYPDDRDRPGVAGTSRLSPHLHWGEISPHQVWHAVRNRETGAGDKGRESFLREVVWREFSYNLLYHWPGLPEEPLREEFASFPWRRNGDRERAWQRGRTGYPIVDAGMRELWHTGWMHNRVRMIVASFLIKDLNVPWQAGAEWFWDTLVDADLASNSASWQWVAGCGADAAPFFRIFNPSLQGTRFDPDGAYVRRWLPELARLPDTVIHTPWKARPLDLADAGIRLGRDYPEPLVDHGAARERALAAFRSLRNEAE